jgi:hypothetical protein
MNLKNTLLALLAMSSSLWGQTITTNTNSLTVPWSTSFSGFQGITNASKAFRVTASNLTTNITVALSDSTNWQVSTNNTIFTNTLSMASNSSNALLWVRMSGSNVGTFTNIISLTSTGTNGTNTNNVTNTTTITGTVVASLASVMYDRATALIVRPTNLVIANRLVSVFTNGVIENPTNFISANRIVSVDTNGVVSNPTNFVSANINTRFVYARNSNSITITNSDTLQNIVSVVLNAGIWNVEMYWDLLGTTNTGTKHGYDFNGSATVRLYRQRASSAGFVNVSGTNFSLGLAEAATLAKVAGVFEVATNGTLYLQAAQNSSNADTLTVGTFNRIIATKIE